MSLITNVVRGSDADRLLLLVHGYGADERDLGGLLPYLDPDGRFVTVLPRGPVALPGTPGFAWYDFGLPAAEIAAAFESALDAARRPARRAVRRARHVRAARRSSAASRRAPVSRSRSALRAQRPAAPAGVLAMSPALPPASLDETSRLGRRHDDPGARAARHPRPARSRCSGARPRPRARGARRAASCTREYPMEHQVAMESVQRARTWLDAVVAGERPTSRCPSRRSRGWCRRSRPRSWRPRCCAATCR